jgi:hypothetical protein
MSNFFITHMEGEKGAKKVEEDAYAKREARRLLLLERRAKSRERCIERDELRLEREEELGVVKRVKRVSKHSKGEE